VHALSVPQQVRRPDTKKLNTLCPKRAGESPPNRIIPNKPSRRTERDLRHGFRYEHPIARLTYCGRIITPAASLNASFSDVAGPPAASWPEAKEKPLA